jgi:hypothetical protein
LDALHGPCRSFLRDFRLREHSILNSFLHSREGCGMTSSSVLKDTFSLAATLAHLTLFVAI